jgi:hypothetical protein
MCPNVGISIDGQMINILAYADDTVLLASSIEDLEKLIAELIQRGQKYNIEVNEMKTKVMVGLNVGSAECKTRFGYEQVNAFTYLGVRIDENLKHDRDVRVGIERARAAFWRNKEILRNNLSLRCKKKLVNTQVFSVLNYCAETYTLTKTLKKKIAAFEMWCYRRLLKISWTSLTSNEKVLERMGLERPVLLDGIIKRKCQYLGHVARGSAGEMLLRLCRDEKKIGRGRKRRRWTDDLEDIAGGKTFIERTVGANNKCEWRRKVNERFS